MGQVPDGSEPCDALRHWAAKQPSKQAVSSLLLCVPYFGVESKTILPAVNGAHEVVQCAAPIAVKDSLNTHWHGRDNQTLGGLLVFFSPVRYEYSYHTSLKEAKGSFQQSPVTLGVKASFLHSRKLHAGIKHTSLMLSISTIASPGLIFPPSFSLFSIPIRQLPAQLRDRHLTKS